MAAQWFVRKVLYLVVHSGAQMDAVMVDMTVAQSAKRQVAK